MVQSAGVAIGAHRDDVDRKLVRLSGLQQRLKVRAAAGDEHDHREHSASLSRAGGLLLCRQSFGRPYGEQADNRGESDFKSGERTDQPRIRPDVG